MRVLFITPWYPTRNRRQAGVFVREQVKSVLSCGGEVAVLHISDARARFRGRWRMVREDDPELSEGILTYHLYSRPVRLPRLLWWAMAMPSYLVSYSLSMVAAVAAFRRLRRAGFRPDVINAHVYTAGVPAVVIGKLFRVPVVVTEHYTRFPLRTLPRGGLKKARFAFGHAARVLPVSSALQQAIEAYGISARFEIVPNAVDTSVFHPGTRRRAAGKPKKLIFVGGLEPTHHKGFPTLLAALVALRDRRTDWLLEIVGDGPSRVDYESRVGKAGMQSCIQFRGAMAKPQVAKAMRDSDAFVLSSRVETGPCVVMEALASGLPVVATRVGDVPEMVSDRDGLVVAPEDAGALTDALDRILSGLDTYDRADISARAGSRYGLAAVGKRLTSIYGDVLSKRR
jgi:glycosyltransferase involved in cell wall biosynthesis